MKVLEQIFPGRPWIQFFIVAAMFAPFVYFYSGFSSLVFFAGWALGLQFQHAWGTVVVDRTIEITIRSK